MKNINLLVLEAMSSGDVWFYKSDDDKNPEDDIKSIKASQITALNKGATAAVQKFSGNIGGSDKYFSKVDIDSPSENTMKIREKNVKKFNKILGEKIL